MPCRLVLRIERDGPFLGRLPRDSMKGPVMSAEVAEVKVPFKLALSSLGISLNGSIMPPIPISPLRLVSYSFLNRQSIPR